MSGWDGSRSSGQMSNTPKWLLWLIAEVQIELLHPSWHCGDRGVADEGLSANSNPPQQIHPLGPTFPTAKTEFIQIQQAPSP